MPNSLKLAYLETPLGSMAAIADSQVLYLLKFVDSCELDREISQLEKNTSLVVASGKTNVTNLIEQELNQYFAGQLQRFKTPVKMSGTQFQKTVWQQLSKILYGHTCSYLELATIISKSTAWRAVANANGANNLAIIIPCHRVISVNNKIGGYSSGIERKLWLLDHEKLVSKNI